MQEEPLGWREGKDMCERSDVHVHGRQPQAKTTLASQTASLLTVLAVGRDLVMKDGRTRRWKPWIQMRSPSLYTSTT